MSMALGARPYVQVILHFSPPAYLCAVTYMIEISLIVTLNNQFGIGINQYLLRSHCCRVNGKVGAIKPVNNHTWLWCHLNWSSKFGPQPLCSRDLMWRHWFYFDIIIIFECVFGVLRNSKLIIKNIFWNKILTFFNVLILCVNEEILSL